MLVIIFFTSRWFTGAQIKHQATSNGLRSSLKGHYTIHTQKQKTLLEQMCA